MVKRILEATRSDFEAMSSKDLAESIAASDGRTIAAEVMVCAEPLVDGVTNAELAAAFGADLIILNMYDVQKPEIIPFKEGPTIKDLKKLVGRPIGIRLEPADPEAIVLGKGEYTQLPGRLATRYEVTPGRLATRENVKTALKQGIDFINLTGNPNTGVTNRLIKKSIRELKEEVGDKLLVFAGRQHSTGIAGETSAQITTVDDAKDYVKAGCDGVIVPSPGAVPGITVDIAKELVDAAHGEGALAMSCMSTSQEGADADTIRRIALYGKMTGADIYHIGDAGYYPSMAAPENIMAYSVAIKGRRHTYRRMAMSPAR